MIFPTISRVWAATSLVPAKSAALVQTRRLWVRKTKPRKAR